MTRQALHAARLTIVHPIRDEPMTFEAPLPEDMTELIALLREHRFLARPTMAGTAVDTGGGGSQDPGPRREDRQPSSDA